MNDAERFFCVPCERCGGAGEIAYAVYSWDGPCEESAPCERCGGTGEELIEDADPCRTNSRPT